MHAIAVGRNEYEAQLDLLRRMYRLRRRVFRDRLAWDVSSADDMEIDVFDVLGPTYLVAVDNNTDPVGCVRLLPTTGPTMLADAFPVLLSGAAPPCDLQIFESSRFCVDTERMTDASTGGLNQATFVLFAAMVEYLAHVGGRSIVTVTDVRMERILRCAGWPLEWIGTPQSIGTTLAVAGFLHGGDAALVALRRHGGLERPVLAPPGCIRIAG